MTYQPVVIALPIADRRRSYDFYRQALGLEAVGEPDESGIPEPLQFAVNAGTRVMLIPPGGFERATGGGPAAPPGQHECFVAISAATPADTDALVQRAVAAGADLVLPQASSRGDMWARSPTQTGTCGWCGPVHDILLCLPAAGAAGQNPALSCEVWLWQEWPSRCWR